MTLESLEFVVVSNIIISLYFGWRQQVHSERWLRQIAALNKEIVASIDEIVREIEHTKKSQQEKQGK